MKDRLTVGLTGVLMATSILEWVAAPHHSPKFPWHHVPGFMALLGLVSCITVVLVSKWIGKKFLQRPEELDE